MITGSTVFDCDVPIGSIIAWDKNLYGNLPDNFCECNGQVLSDPESVFNGDTIPDLNSTNRMLRGNVTSGGSGGSPTHTHDWNFSTSYLGGPGSNYCATAPINTSSESNYPPYYDVVWVMRIK